MEASPIVAAIAQRRQFMDEPGAVLFKSAQTGQALRISPASFYRLFIDDAAH